MAQLRESLESDRVQHSGLMGRLADSERRLGQLNIELNNTRKRQREIEAELTDLAK